MANENIGDIACPFCKQPAHVRRYSPKKPPAHADGEQRHGKMYVHCADCGPILASSKRVQDYILDHANIYGAEKPKDSPPVKEGAPAAASPPKKANTPPAAAKVPAAQGQKVSFDFDPYA